MRAKPSQSPKPGFNPWPYSIIGFFAVAVAAALSWVVFCIGQGTDLVAADYYEQEVEYQNELDRIERARELSTQAGISYNVPDATIRIRLPLEHARVRPEGVIHLYRPSQAGLDQTVRLEVRPDGEQRVDATSLAPGLWEVRVRWTALGEEFFLKQKLEVTRNRS